ncbi:hypothetical protein ACFFJI_03625 [Allobacillus sp. GCM10007491]|uniref:Phospholipase A2-like domain-containing protein n=1 Tax=Allobacillus saliphilus TaxID=2912308 RepID=A0A941HV03_9BACI|nr:hypothetical protein [Allobacillus saliphilus]MBR7554934.1 hypothetical protein [Allobacillus saliphilus]
MKEDKWGLAKISVNKSTKRNLDWLTINQKEQIQKMLNYSGLKEINSKNFLEQDSVELTFDYGEDQRLNVTTQTLKITNNVKVEIVNGDNIPFYARLYHLIRDKDKNFLEIIAIENEVILIHKKEETDIQSLNFKPLYKSSSSETVKDGNISLQAWYDIVPCIGSGCCAFPEPLWPGGPYVTIPYNWCGNNCGSGSPVNSVDECCRTHDYCYGAFPSYPDRCNCDQNLLNCLDGISGYGGAPTLIRTAFRGKMSIEGC